MDDWRRGASRNDERHLLLREPHPAVCDLAFSGTPLLRVQLPVLSLYILTLMSSVCNIV